MLFENHLFPKSPDGKLLACGSQNGFVNIFDVATGKLLHTVEGLNKK